MSWGFQNLIPGTLAYLGFSESDTRDICLLGLVQSVRVVRVLHVCFCSHIIFTIFFVQHCFYLFVAMLQQQQIEIAQATA